MHGDRFERRVGSLDKKATTPNEAQLLVAAEQGRIGNLGIACTRRRLRSGAEKEAEDRGGAEDGPTDRELASSTYSIVFDAYITLTDSGESDSDSVVSSVETELSASVLASALEATSLFSPGTISVSGSTFVLGTRAPTPAAEAWASTEAPTLAAVMRTTFGTDDGGRRRRLLEQDLVGVDDRRRPAPLVLGFHSDAGEEKAEQRGWVKVAPRT